MLLRLSQIGKSFLAREGTRRVLSRVSMAIAPGEAVALMGRNGIGKSTLAAIIAGVDEDFEGVIDRAPGVAAQAPMIFQDFRASLLPWLSVEANVAFPLALRGVPAEERRRRARELLARAPIRLDPITPIRKLSGGQAQLVCILRALIVSPRMLVCDEPFSAIDYPSRMMLRELIAETCRAAGIALVFVSHSIDDTLYLADRILVLGGQPASIIGAIDVPAPGKRDGAWLETEAGVDVRRQVRLALSDLQ